MYKVVLTCFAGLRGINMDNVDYHRHTLSNGLELKQAVSLAEEHVGKPYAWTAPYRIKPTTIVGLVMCADVEEE
jgi:hypothetical protein